MALCYVYFPLANQLSEFLDLKFSRNSIDLAFVLVVVGAILNLVFKRLNISVYSALSAVVALLLILWIYAGYVFNFSPLPTALMEAKPLVYFLIALLVVESRLIPSIQAFCYYGSILSVILTAEFLIRSLSSGALVRPIGSGEVNYDAALILLSLVVSFADKRYFYRFAPLLVLGVLASFSRTGVLALCAVFLLADFVQIKYRILVISIAFLSGLLSFAMRGLEINSLESLDRYWMWLSGIDYILNNISSSIIVFAPGSPLNVAVPPYVEELWLKQQEVLGVEGIYPFHFHAFWLRLMVGWGWLPVLLLLFYFYFKFTKKGAGIEVRSYILVCLILGLTMGLFYLSNVSVPYLVAGLVLFNKNLHIKMVCSHRNRSAYGMCRA